MKPSPAPGWYPDPYGRPGRFQYWNGEAWQGTGPMRPVGWRDYETAFKVAAVFAVSIGFLLILGMIRNHDDAVRTLERSTAAHRSGTSSTAGASGCQLGPFENPFVQAALKEAESQSGARIVGEQELASIEDSSKLDVVVRICQPGVTGDALKDAATSVAYSILRSPIGASVKSLRVTNVSEEGDPQGKVRVEDFQSYTFASDSGCCVNRVPWKYPSE